MKLIIELDDKDYEELNTFYILNLGTEEYRKIIEKHCTDAIRHGTPYNPQGDLISRSEVMKLIPEVIGGQNDFADCIRDSVKQIIDNAPTVETDIEVVAKDAYEHGYTDGWKERFGEPDERPKGEWIVIHNALGETKYQCNQCQHYVKPSDDKNFCPNCGADLRKGGDNA